jgi:hypothetical protein
MDSLEELEAAKKLIEDFLEDTLDVLVACRGQNTVVEEARLKLLDRIYDMLD